MGRRVETRVSAALEANQKILFAKIEEAVGNQQATPSTVESANTAAQTALMEEQMRKQMDQLRRLQEDVRHQLQANTEQVIEAAKAATAVAAQKSANHPLSP